MSTAEQARDAVGMILLVWPSKEAARACSVGTLVDDAGHTGSGYAPCHSITVCETGIDKTNQAVRYNIRYRNKDT